MTTPVPAALFAGPAPAQRLERVAVDAAPIRIWPRDPPWSEKQP